MEYKSIQIEATSLPDAWFQTIYKCLEVGRDFTIDRGSFAGTKRLEFDYITVNIKCPSAEPRLPQIPSQYNIPNPVADDYLADYIPYLMTGAVKEGESYCYDDITEILTNNGWKLFKNLKSWDMVATLNPNTNTLVYQSIINFHKMRYKGDMFYVNTKQIDLGVTPNHTIYISHPKKTEFSLKKIKNVYTQYRLKFKRNCIWNGIEEEYFILPPIKYNNDRYVNYGKERKIKMDDWLQFLGYWIADGSLRRNQKNKYAIVITKNKGNIRNKILNILNKIFSNVCIYGKDLIVDDKQIFSYLEQFGRAGDKYIPNDLLNLSSRQLKILFDCMYVCDGNNSKNVKYCRYNTKSKYLADNVQEILLKIGLCGVVSKDSGIYRIRIGNSNNGSQSSLTPCITKNNIKIDNYSGNIYCVEVKDYHILYVRRNGKPCWCGNTYGQRICAYPIESKTGNIGTFEGGEPLDYLISQKKEILYQEQEFWNDPKIIFKNTKGEYCLNQIELLIWTYKNKGFRNNQMVLQIAHPTDMLLQDPPCLRAIDTRIQDNKLNFIVQFRSWDLWGGFPANLAGIQFMKEYIASEIGVEDGSMIVTSKGLHIYDYVWQLAEIVRGKTIDQFKKEMLENI